MSWIGDVVGTIGSLAGGYLSGRGAEQATARQVAWERERAQNAHQWEVQDLIKAGLNPILSAGGQGAVTSSIDAVNTKEGYANAFNNMATNAIALKQIKINLQKQKADIKNQTGIADAEIANKNADTINKMEEKGLITARTAKEYANINLMKSQGNLFSQQIKESKTNTAYKAKQIELTEKQIDDIINKISLSKKLDKRQEMELKANIMMNIYKLGMETPQAISSALKLIPFGKYIW